MKLSNVGHMTSMANASLLKAKAVRVVDNRSLHCGQRFERWQKVSAHAMFFKLYRKLDHNDSVIVDAYTKVEIISEEE